MNKKNFKETVINQIFYAKARSSFFIHNWAILLSLPLYFQSMQLYFFFQLAYYYYLTVQKNLYYFFTFIAGLFLEFK